MNISKIYRQKTIDRIILKAKMLGIADNFKVKSFLNERLIVTIFLFFVFFVFFKYGYILAPLVSIIFYIGIEKVIFDLNIKKRAKILEKDALFFFEVFALTLEGGRNIKRALELTCNSVESELSFEFRKTLEEIKLGKTFNESLEAMKKRMPSETINNTILNMIEANILGNNILNSIYNQIAYLREKQRLNIKAEIVKLPTKVSIVSVLFFVPIMLLIILAPVLIQYLD